MPRLPVNQSYDANNSINNIINIINQGAETLVQINREMLEIENSNWFEGLFTANRKILAKNVRRLSEVSQQHLQMISLNMSGLARLNERIDDIYTFIEQMKGVHRDNIYVLQFLNNAKDKIQSLDNSNSNSRIFTKVVFAISIIALLISSFVLYKSYFQDNSKKEKVELKNNVTNNEEPEINSIDISKNSSEKKDNSEKVISKNVTDSINILANNNIYDSVQSNNTFKSSSNDDSLINADMLLTTDNNNIDNRDSKRIITEWNNKLIVIKQTEISQIGIHKDWNTEIKAETTVEYKNNSEIIKVWNNKEINLIKENSKKELIKEWNN
ncbi:MAG: hypothetical protein ACOYN6_06635 [Ignavibacteria bacterium]